MLHSIPAEKKLVLYSTECVGLLEAKKRARSVFLCATFAICRLKMTAKNIYGLLAQHFHYSTLAPYCDMGGKISHMLDCLKAFEKAVAQGLIEFDKFDVQKYNREDSRYNLNWIVPKKLLAMADPQTMPDFGKVRKHLKEIGVKVVVRLNKHDNLLKYGRGVTPPRLLLLHYYFSSTYSLVGATARRWFRSSPEDAPVQEIELGVV